jgi:hypothetical protein
MVKWFKIISDNNIEPVLPAADEEEAETEA